MMLTLLEIWRFSPLLHWFHFIQNQCLRLQHKVAASAHIAVDIADDESASSSQCQCYVLHALCNVILLNTHLSVIHSQHGPFSMEFV